MKPRFKYGCSRWLMFRAVGHVLFYPYVMFRAPRDRVSDQLFRHELEHVYQIQRMGVWTFRFKYLWELIRFGYRLNAYELHANGVENTPLTAAEQEMRKQ